MRPCLSVFLPRLLKEVEHQLKKLGVRFFGVRIGFDELECRRENPFDQRGRVSHHQRAEPGTANDDEFGDLQQHGKVAMMHGIAAEDASKNDK